MRSYHPTLPGFRRGRVRLELDPDLGVLTLLVDDRIPPKGPAPGSYLVNNDAGDEIAVCCGMTDDHRPWLKVDGVEVSLGAGLSWFEYSWIGAPLVLVFAGGLIGGLLGGGAAALNYRIMGSRLPRGSRFLFSGMVSATAVLVFLAIAGMLHLWIKPGGEAKTATVESSPNGDSPASCGTPAVVWDRGDNVSNLYIDNPGAGSLACKVDGQPCEPVPPYRFLALRVKPGKHRIEATVEGQAPKDIQVAVDKEKVCLVNPRGQGQYRIQTQSYSDGSALGLHGSVFGEQEPDNVALIETDFGLLEDLPEAVMITSRLGVGDRLVRTRLVKVLPATLDAEQAEAVLSLNAAQRTTAYAGDVAENQALLVAALGTPPTSERKRDLLLAQAEAADSEAVLAAALGGLNPYLADVPEETLRAWLSKADTVMSPRSDSPARGGRPGWAAGVLIGRGLSEPVAQAWSALAPAARAQAMQRFKDGPAERWPDLIRIALADPTIDAQSTQDALQLAVRPDFVPDDGLRQVVDAAIPRIPNEQEKANWQRFWREKNVRDCQAAAALTPYQQAFLLSAVEQEDEISAALSALAKHAFLGRLADRFERFPPNLQLRILRELPYREPGVPVPAEEQAMAWQGVAADNDDVRDYAVHWLATTCAEPLPFLRKMWERIRQLDDERERAELATRVWNAGYRMIDTLDEAALLAVVAEGGEKTWINAAIDRLERRDQRNPGSFVKLAKIFPQIVPEAARVLVAERCTRISYLDQAEDDFLKAYQALFAAAMRDPAPAVRARGLDGALAMARRDFPTAEQISQVVSAEKDEKEKLRLLQAAEQQQVGVWSRLTSDRELRAEAIRRLLSLAARSRDEKISGRAADAIPRIEEPEQEFVAALEKLAVASPFWETRREALRKVGWLDKEKHRPAFLKALADKAPEIRWDAFQALAGDALPKYVKDRALATKLKAVAAREPDQRTRDQMEKMIERYER